MSWDLNEDHWKQIKASVKESRGNFIDDSADELDSYRLPPKVRIKPKQMKMAAENIAFDSLNKVSQSNTRKKL